MGLREVLQKVFRRLGSIGLPEQVINDMRASRIEKSQESKGREHE